MAETEEAPDPLIGRLVGQKFKVERILGAGAMGRVYLAEQTNLGKPIALKVLHTSMVGDASLAKRFYREAKSASMLSHPNILQIIDFGDDQGLLFIAMELLTGRDLYRAIKMDWPLSLERIGHIGGQILSALDEAHAKGVIHRDLKPENVMLLDVRGESDFVKVCDFGIAKIASERDGEGSAITVAGMVCGTPEYMSPEQAKGEPLDGRSDLYSAATILYQMVAGEVPFRAESALGVITKQLHEEPVPPSQRRSNVACPPALEAVILRGLRKAREDRFESASHMKHALLESVGMRRVGSSNAAIARSGAGLTDVAMAATGVSTPMATPAASSSPSTSRASASASSIAGSPVAAGGSSLSGGAPIAGSAASASASTPVSRGRGALVVGVFAILGVGGTAAYVLNTRPKPMPTANIAPQNPPAIAQPNPPPPNPPSQNAPSLPSPSPTAAVDKAENSSPANVHAGTPSLAATSAAAHKHDKHSSAAKAPAAASASDQEPLFGGGPAAPVAEAAAALPAIRPAATAHTFAGAFADGEQLFRGGDVEGALARYQEAARLNTSDAKTQRQIGKCYNRLGQRDRALPFFKRYLELDPDASDAAFIRAMLDGK